MRLIDAEELLERFKWYEEMPANPYPWDFVGIENVIGEAPTIEVPRWVPVSERLPDESGKYIVCTTKGSVYCARFYKASSVRYPNGYFGTDSNTKITHWMPLPEAPKDGE